MSADGDEIPGREIAYRVFAAEYDDATLSYAESDEERAPNYVITPTGARLNRLFAVGTLTEVTSVNDEMVRARVVDPTGAFVVYAGQYQPDELAFLEGIEPPAFVAVTGKARTFQPEDSDRVYTSIRPESIATVDADTRDRWVVSAAEQTVERVGTFAAAAGIDASGDALTEALRDAGVEDGLASGIPLARDHYGTTPAYLAALRDCAVEAVEVVADERDEVSGLSVQPGETSPDYETATFGALADPELVDGLEPTEDAPSAEPAAATAGGGESAVGEAVSSGSAVGAATGDEPDAAAEAELEFESETDPAETSDAPEIDDAPETAEADGDAEAVDAVDDGADDATATGPDSGDDALGDFDAEGMDDGMYEMDDEEREQLEEEFGAEFTTGADVDEPGEADIDVPEPDAEGDEEESDDDLGSPPESGLESESVEPEAEDEGESADDDLESGDESEASDEVESDDESEDAAEAAADGDADEPADDVDLQEYVVETMQELDDGDGADRTELVETVAADTGAAESDVEDAIEEALMGGQCYEPDDETLKAI